MRRLLLVLIIGFLPLSAYADDAGLLGPQSSPSGQSGSDTSTQASSLLQPAGATPISSLQAAGTVGALGQSSPQSNPQQNTPTEQQKLLIQSDADGGVQSSTGSSSTAEYIVLALVALAAAAGAWWLWRQRKLPPK